ncbi:MAG TPA: hypothetical protein VM493_05380, partial [Vicinamibacterales bacterium]|nr:hypothetical protein [Vicinamibacterales bacterium]
IGTLWPLYLTIFGTVTYGVAAAESALLLSSGPGLMKAFVFLGLMSATLRWIRIRRTQELPGLCFEAQPETMTEVTLRAL